MKVHLAQIPLLGPLVARRDLRIAEQAVANYRARIIAEDEALARVELPTRLLQNCRIVPDRTAMLDWMPKAKLWCEVGAGEGEFAEQILAHAQPKALHLIDSWSAEHDRRYANAEEAVKARLGQEPVTTHRGRSTDMLAAFPDGYFDIIYLDAGHGYADTVAELALCRQKLAAGGLLAGHDYVTGMWQSQLRYGVVEAVNAFCIRWQWEFVLVTWECHRHISFVLRALQS